MNNIKFSGFETRNITQSVWLTDDNGDSYESSETNAENFCAVCGSSAITLVRGNQCFCHNCNSDFVGSVTVADMVGMIMRGATLADDNAEIFFFGKMDPERCGIPGVFDENGDFLPFKENPELQETDNFWRSVSDDSTFQLMTPQQLENFLGWNEDYPAENFLESIVVFLATIEEEKPTPEILNTTPHAITLADADGQNPQVIEPCGTLLNATAQEIPVESTIPGVELVETRFVGNEEGEAFLTSVPTGTIVIGSMIAAQAYPGRVMALVPCSGFERVPIAEKRMRRDKFTVFIQGK